MNSVARQTVAADEDAPQANSDVLAGRDIVVLSDDWNGLPNSTMHLMRHFLAHHRVFWFNMIGRMPSLSTRDIKKAAQIANRWCLGSAIASRASGMMCDRNAGPTLLNPKVIPYFKRPVRRLNAMSLRSTYRAMCRTHSVHSPVIVSSLPAAIDLVSEIRNATTVYYCVDEWSEYPSINNRDWVKMEQEMLEGCDAFVATSKALLSKSRPGCPSLYLPQGVDHQHFSGRSSSPQQIESLACLPRPIVGFFGMISPWVDLGIVAALSRRMPEASFVLIGKVDSDVASLPRADNIHYIDSVPYADLPAYARHFDVGLIPFVANQLTRAVNPLKLLEYYALGLPVLATRLPELEDSQGPIYLASNYDEFCQQLELIVSEPNGASRAKATAVAKDNSWAHRASTLRNFLVDVSMSGRPDPTITT